MKFKNLGGLIFIISIVAFLINLYFIYPKQILLICFIPLIFGLLSLSFIPKELNAGPGLSISILVMILRYVLSPILLSTSSFSSYFNNTDNNTLITFGLIVLEMIVIILMIWKYSNQNEEINVKPIIKNFSYIVPILFLAISFIWSLSDPIPVSRYNFILSSADELVKTDLTDSDRGLPRVLNYTHYFIIISLFFYFYKLHSLKKQKIYFIIGFPLVILITSFYQDSSRNSMLIPLLTVLFLGIKIYPKYKKVIILSLTIAIFLSMSVLSFMKFFSTDKIEKELVSLDISAKYLNDYFGGFYEVYLAVEFSEPIKDKIDNKTLFNDVFGQVIFLNRYIDLENRSSKFYNETAYNDSHIFPTIGQGYNYFGFLFSWVFTFIVFRFIFLLDNLFKKTNRIDLAFTFALHSISLGWLHPGSFVLATTILSKFLVFYLIVLFSAYLGKKIKFELPRY